MCANGDSRWPAQHDRSTQIASCEEPVPGPERTAPARLTHQATIQHSCAPAVKHTRDNIFVLHRVTRAMRQTLK